MLYNAGILNRDVVQLESEIMGTIVTADEVKQLLKAHGWLLSLQVRRGQGKRFVYAKRRQGLKIVSRYIASESRLAEITPDDVLRRIRQ